MAAQPADEADDSSTLFSALPIMVWQRRWLVIVPVLLAIVVGLATAFLMHRVFQSSATVLIESQQVPDTLIGVNANPNDNGALIDQRISRARERVLSRQELIRLIRTYQLYDREQQTMPLSKIIDKMRNATTIDALDNGISLAGPRQGMGANSIAITVAFEYDDPVKAQLVAQQFVDHFLEADASTQASQASDTVNVLTEQANNLQAQITDLERRATQVRSENGAVLALNGLTGNAPQDYSQIDSQVAALQAQNARLQADKPTADLDPGVAQAEAQLRILQAKLSDTHPDVLTAKAQLEAARRDAAARPSAANPAAAQIAANRAQIASLQSARGMIASQSSSYRSAASRGPAIASQLDQMEKAADLLRDQYRNSASRLQAAQIQARIESEQKGERLTLADPPVVPDHPLRPNRPVIIAGSIAAGLAVGIALVFLVELILRPIRGTAGLRAVIGQAPLAVIPDFDQKRSLIARWIERRVRRKAGKMARA